VDYSGILKRAWQIAWKHKILWLFGLFAGGMGGGFGGGGNTSSGNFGTGSGRSSLPFGSEQQFAEFARRSLPLVIAVTFLIIVLALVWWVIAIAARGGIIHLVNEAEEGRAVRAGDGWRVGFSKWGRVFGIRFLAGLPVFIIAAIMGALIAVAMIGGAASGAFARGGGSALGPVIAAISGLCLVFAVFVIVIVVLIVIVLIVTELATRYAVLKDVGVMDSLRHGWSDLRAKRGAFLMYLIQVGVSFAFSIVVVIVALILILPGGIVIATGAWPVGLLMIVLAGLVLLVPAAAYGAYYNTVWTIFFRRMTGMEPAAATALPGVHPGAGAGFPPPPSPYQPAPPTGEPPVGV
jgi:hypothetical protein